VKDLDELKTKVMAPSVRQALRAKKAEMEFVEAEETKPKASKPVEKDDLALRKKRNVEAAEAKRARSKQAEGDRSGIKVGLVVGLSS